MGERCLFFVPMREDTADYRLLERLRPRGCRDGETETAEFLQFDFGYVPPVGGSSVVDAGGGRRGQRKTLLKESG